MVRKRQGERIFIVLYFFVYIVYFLQEKCVLSFNQNFLTENVVSLITENDLGQETKEILNSK